MLSLLSPHVVQVTIVLCQIRRASAAVLVRKLKRLKATTMTLEITANGLGGGVGGAAFLSRENEHFLCSEFSLSFNARRVHATTGWRCKSLLFPSSGTYPAVEFLMVQMRTPYVCTYQGASYVRVHLQ